MAHELEMIDGEAQMAFTGDRTAVWHRLGKQVPADLSAHQMMVAAGLDWTVNKVPLFAEIDGVRYPTKKNALVRSTDNSILDVVGDTWNPVQNAEAFEFFHDFVEAGEMTMDTAGSIRNGKRVWALAKVSEGVSILGGDKIEPYLLFSNPHQFGACVDIKFTGVRVVCNNTLTWALAGVAQKQVRLNHRSEFNADRVKETLGFAKARLDDYVAQAERLALVKYTEANAKDYFAKMFPVLTTKDESEKELSKQAQRAMEIVETQPGAEYAPGSLWNLFNSVTYITSNEYGKSDDSRLNSVWFGENERRNRKALAGAMAMAD